MFPNWDATRKRKMILKIKLWQFYKLFNLFLKDKTTEFARSFSMLLILYIRKNGSLTKTFNKLLCRKNAFEYEGRNGQYYIFNAC